jgi:wobble nucleotide-excising tRNase
MINKIKRLKSIGKFYDFAAKGSGLDWHKNTFIFAPNAYGKSTLVNVLRSVCENDPRILRARKTLDRAASPEATVIVDGVNCVFDGTRWDKTCPTIRIFDVPYIHDNILSDDIEHEHRKRHHKIIIGARGVELAEQLTTLKADEKSKRQQLDGLTKQFNAGGHVHHTLDAFLAIPAAQEAAVPGRIQELEHDIKSKESETVVRGLGFPRVLSSPAFDLSGAKALAAQKLAAVHEAAEKRVLEHIDRNIKDKGRAKEFIRQGLDLVQADCPFCGEDLRDAADLLQAYREFFDDAFRTYQKELKEKAETLANWNLENDLTALLSSHNANRTTLKQWEPFIGAETLPDATVIVEPTRTTLAGLKAKVQAELEKKQKDPNADADLSQFDAMASELASLKASLEAYNKAVTAFTNKAKTYVSNLLKSDINSIRQALAKEREIEKRFKPEWKKWAGDYPLAKKDADDLLANRDAKQKELENYTKTIFGTHQERINQLLTTVGADFKITDLTGRTDARANESYADFGFLILEKKVPLTVRQDDAACFKNTLSEGDKSTLAIAFFIAALEKIPGLDKQIVILDDPLSSLDETRREGTARVLLDLSPKVNQLCILTHHKDFLRMLFDKISDNTVLQVRSDKKNGSRLEPFDVEDDRKGECAHMLEDMKRYVAEDFGPTPETMQGNIRKVFEVVLKTKYYLALVADIKAKKGLAKLLETLFVAGLLDATLKPKLFDLCGVTNGPHHGDIVDAPSKKLTRDELIPLITEGLSLVQKV